MNRDWDILRISELDISLGRSRQPRETGSGDYISASLAQRDQKTSHFWIEMEYKIYSVL